MPAHTGAGALLQDPDLQQNAKSLMACATKLGIAVPSETATAMLERWLYAERAHRLLKANGLHATLSKLRVPAPAGATRAAPAPAQAGPLAPCGRTGAPIQCAGAGAPVVATATGAAQVAKQQQPARTDNAARNLQRKRARRVTSAASKKLRTGNLDRWKKSDPTFDYDGEIAKAVAARAPRHDPSTVDL